MRLELTATLDPETQRQLNRIEAQLEAILKKEKQIMASIDDVIAAAAAEKTVADSVVELLNRLTQLLKDAIATNDPAKVQAALDAINANKQELADAVTANTPAA